MVVLNCPIEGCTYATGDIEATQAIALFTVHEYSHAPGACQQAKPDKLSPQKYPKRVRVKTGSASSPDGHTRQPHA